MTLTELVGKWADGRNLSGREIYSGDLLRMLEGFSDQTGGPVPSDVGLGRVIKKLFPEVRIVRKTDSVVGRGRFYIFPSDQINVDFLFDDL